MGGHLPTMLDNVGKSTQVGRATCSYKYRQAGETKQMLGDDGSYPATPPATHTHTHHVSAKRKALLTTAPSTSPPENETHTHFCNTGHF